MDVLDETSSTSQDGGDTHSVKKNHWQLKKHGPIITKKFS